MFIVRYNFAFFVIHSKRFLSYDKSLVPEISWLRLDDVIKYARLNNYDDCNNYVNRFCRAI